jgi:hypothetical protein
LGHGRLLRHVQVRSVRLHPLNNHPIQVAAGAYLLRYAQEASWHEDNRRASNGEQAHRLSALAMKRKPSVDFSGYWQRHAATV